ncbi:glutathione peroxidase [Pelagirhabdus alkalitolerans]|uniref:Glutathione peroxidase n=1 Tax=Pelagirhabdus alkalitolerans TaxID=1612202 RepID=A0A1G6KZ80_9BACI|nr:glutathione peroxidase [Pelagirhabdus alkalitolerans]SDC36237.1 glutathione peroxidase [Pelagirhabdus alkalitolerans]
METIYDYEVMQTSGDPLSLSTYEGDVLLIVNTASKCDFTPQFDDLQRLYDKYKDQGFKILGFPCNQFHAQEPGTDEEAKAFCQMNYGVQFPIFSKIYVNGKRSHPLFQYLKEAQPFQGFDDSTMNAKLIKKIIEDRYPEWLTGDEIKWNFTKFLVNRDGEVIERFESHEEPLDFEAKIKELL